ncbi:hypothetical protein V6N13_074399 [Hibiscus sabdariffa]
MRNAFLNLKQGDQTVYEYECEFNRLSRFASELFPTERERIACFIEGLDVDYKEVLVAMDITNFQEAVNRAKGMEKVRAERIATRSAQFPKRGHGGSFGMTSSKRSKGSYQGNWAGSTTSSRQRFGSGKSKARRFHLREQGIRRNHRVQLPVNIAASTTLGNVELLLELVINVVLPVILCEIAQSLKIDQNYLRGQLVKAK